jgi:hypothetical protein
MVVPNIASAVVEAGAGAGALGVLLLICLDGVGASWPTGVPHDADDDLGEESTARKDGDVAAFCRATLPRNVAGA